MTPGRVAMAANLGQILDEGEQKNIISLIQELAEIADKLDMFIKARSMDLQAALGPEYAAFQTSRRRVEAAAPAVERIYERLISSDPLLWYRLTPEERTAFDAWTEGVIEMDYIYENLGRVPATEPGETPETRPVAAAAPGGVSTGTILIAGGVAAALLLLVAVA